jgi:hypothetical protein
MIFMGTREGFLDSGLSALPGGMTAEHDSNFGKRIAKKQLRSNELVIASP